MYEVSYTGFTVTPETLKLLKTNKLYRFKINWEHFYKGILYKRYWQFWSNLSILICNKNIYG